MSQRERERSRYSWRSLEAGACETLLKAALSTIHPPRFGQRSGEHETCKPRATHMVGRITSSPHTAQRQSQLVDALASAEDSFERGGVRILFASR